MNRRRTIGRIIKRYRTILRICRIRDTLGSLAVAGILVMGAAGGVHAVPATAPWTDPSVTIDSGTSLTVDELFDPLTDKTTDNISTTSLTLNGGSLTIETGCTLRNVGSVGTGLTFLMQGGDLTLNRDTVLDTKEATIEGGNISIEGTRLSAENLTIGGDVSIKLAGLPNQITSAGLMGQQSFVMGTMHITDTASISVAKGNTGMLFSPALTISGNATFDVGGTLRLGYQEMFPNTVTQTGGTITVQKGDISYLDGGTLNIIANTTLRLQGGQIINNGNITVSGTLDLTGGGNGLVNNGFIGVAGTTSYGLAKIILDDAQLAALLQTEGAKIAVGGQAVLDLGGSARVDANLFRTNYDIITETKPLLDIRENGKLKATSLTLSGDSLEMDPDGQIYVNSLALDTQELALTSGKILLRGESGSTLTATGGSLRLDAAATADAELRLGQYDSETGTLATGGTINANITAATGTVSVVAGAWTQNAGKTLDIQSGSVLTVGGATDANYQNGAVMPAKLVINGTLLSADAGNGTQGINVKEGGTLEAVKNALLSGTDRASGLSTIDVAAGGYLRVSGLGTVSKNDLAAIQANLMTGAGTFDIADATIGGAEVRPDGTIDYADLPPGGITSDTYRDAVVVNVNGPLSGNFTGVQLADGGSISVDAGTTLVLNGNKGGDLITDSSGTLAGISTSGAFYLGEAGQAGSGVIGDVTLASAGGSLTVQGSGSYSAGTIDAVNPNEGVVRSTGAALTAAAIGSNGNPVGLVEAKNDGSITALGDIDTQTLNLAYGDVLSQSAITAANATIDSATLQAAGNITLKGNGTNAGKMTNGNIISGGSILLQDAFSGTGRIEAAGDIQGTSIVNSVYNTIGLRLFAGGTIKADHLSIKYLRASRLETTGMVQLVGGGMDLTGSEPSHIGGALELFFSRAEGINLEIDGPLNMYSDSTASFANLSVQGPINWIGKGTDEQGSRLTVSDTLSLNGSVLAVDPAWGGEASNVAVNSINDTASAADILINGGVAVGQNAYAAVGTADNAWLPGQTPGGLSQGGITAALGIFRPLTVAGGGKLYVDGALADAALVDGSAGAYDVAAADSATFAPGSLLVVNGANADILNGTPAITFQSGSGSVIAEDGAKLSVTDAVANRQYGLLAGTPSVTLNGSGWQGGNLLTSSRMLGLNADVDSAAGTVTLTAVLNDARTAFPGISDGMAAAVTRLYAPFNDPTLGWTDLADVNSPSMGVRFLSRATDTRFVGPDSEPAVCTIESAARMAIAGAVPQMTKMAADAAADAVTSRTSLASPAGGLQSMNAEGRLAEPDASGFALWITPAWQNRSAYNLEAGHLDGGFNGNIGGISLGADYTFENALRAGVALSLGGGYAVSAGDFADTTNSMSYWGVEAYAGWYGDGFALMADVGYTGSYHKLEQELGAGMQMRDLEADVRAGAWQAGLRAEYRFDGSVLDVIPHVGARYMNLTTWGHDVTSNGVVLEADSMIQNIWTFPVGVTFSQDFSLDGDWYVRPSLDVTLIPAAGDIRARGDVRFTGLPGMYTMESQIMDYLTWQGSAGLEFGCDNMALGVSYTVQTGQTGTGHGVFAGFRYEF